MKIKTALQLAAVVLALAMVPTLAMAQNAGFRTGIAQATFGFPPTQAPEIVTRSTFTATPTVVLPSPPVQPFQTVIVPAQIVFISNQIPIAGQTIIPVQPPVAGQMPIAGQPAAPIWTRPGSPAVPGAGTPRHEVL